jgi:hypothetical protein
MTEEARREVSSLKGPSIDAGDIPVLCGLVMEVLDWSRTAYGENSLGVNPSILTRFLHMRGSVRKLDATKVANRIRTLLKSQDQSYKSAPPVPLAEPDRRPDVVPQFAIRGERWVSVRTTSEIELKIATLASILDSIIQQAGRSNVPEDEQALSQIDRQQLIAILETALNVLRSPIVESGLMKKARDALVKGAASAAEKGVQEGLGALMQAASHRIGELIAMLFT